MRQERFGVVESGVSPSLDIGFGLAFSCLVALVPESDLIDGDRQCGAKLDHAVVAFGDLQLRTWLVQPVLLPELGGQRDRASTQPPLERVDGRRR
ncbi:hypothetical protein [Nocardia fluminea]|uniref:hypothetical protein n=1 Tax=Nocardia fluminea TaxID=134984 RepID=UPI0033DA51E5